MGDLKAAQRASDRAEDQEIALIARLTGLVPKDVELLDLAGFERLLDLADLERLQDSLRAALDGSSPRRLRAWLAAFRGQGDGSGGVSGLGAWLVRERLKTSAG